MKLKLVSCMNIYYSVTYIGSTFEPMSLIAKFLVHPNVHIYINVQLYWYEHTQFYHTTAEGCFVKLVLSALTSSSLAILLRKFCMRRRIYIKYSCMHVCVYMTLIEITFLNISTCINIYKYFALHHFKIK